MSNIQAKKYLEKINDEVRVDKNKIITLIEKNKYEDAYDLACKTIAKLELDIKKSEELRIAPEEPFSFMKETSDEDTQKKLRELLDACNSNLRDLYIEKNRCLALQSAQFSLLLDTKINKEYQQRLKQVDIDRFYRFQYNKVSHLLDQRVGGNLHHQVSDFLYHVREYHTSNKVSKKVLSHILELGYRRLTNQMTAEDFSREVNKIKNKSSVPLKVLGALLTVIGVGLGVAGIFFAPAVITSATIGLGAIWAYALATSVTSSALTLGGTSCFFKKQPTTELTGYAKKLDHSQLDTEPYTLSSPTA